MAHALDPRKEVLIGHLMDVAAEASLADCFIVEIGCLALIRAMHLQRDHQQYVSHLFADMTTLLESIEACGLNVAPKPDRRVDSPPEPTA